MDKHGPPIIQINDVRKSFRAADGRERPVLEGVDFTLREGEIVALLGPSGSGKSTLLRILAGLIGVDAGSVQYRGQPLYGPARAISMVGGPPCIAWSVHGLSAASVGVYRSSPAGSKIDSVT